MSITRLIGTALLTMSLALGASACGSDDSNSTSADPAVTSGTGAAGDDLIVKPLEGVGATKVDIGPDEVRAHFNGSVDDATAWTYCSVVEMLVGQKAAFVVYPDGELDCADRSGG